MADNSSKFVNDLAQIGRAVVNGGYDAVELNEAIDRGNTLATDNQILMDSETLSPIEFSRKYGRGVQNLVGRLNQAGVALDKYKSAPGRTNGEVALDLGINAATGLASSLGGIGAAAAGIFDSDLGTGATERLNAGINYMRRPLSQYMKRNEYLEGIRSKLDHEDNEKIYEKELKEEGKFVATLRNIGRDIYSTGKRIVQNPALLESTVAQGTGSLLAGGPLAKGLQAFGVGARVAMPTAIGLMEAGGAYTDTTSEVMSRSHEELMESSPEYRRMIANGLSPDDAQRQIANNAGIVSGMIQGAIGAGIGKLTGAANFEAAPFAVRSINQAVRDIGKETAEESAQSVTAQMAKNYGISQQADPSQRLTEGIGEQAVLGAVGGLGAATGVQAPGIAGKVVSKMAADAFEDIKGTVGIERYEAIRAKARKEASVSGENIRADVENQAARVEQVSQALKDLAQEFGGPDHNIEDYVEKVMDAIQVDDTDIEAMPSSVVKPIKEMTERTNRLPNKYEALAAAAMVATSKDAPKKDRISAATFVLKTVENNKKLFQEDYPEFLSKIPADRPEAKIFNQFAQIMTMIEESDELAEALNWAREKMRVDEKAPKLSTPEGAKFVNTAVDVATYAPQAIEPHVIDDILSQADEGTFNLSPERRRILRSAMALHDAARVFEMRSRTMEPETLDRQVGELEQELEATRLNDNMLEFINKQIHFDGGPRESQLSLNSHLAGFNQSVSMGDMKGAKTKLEHLANFAQSHINKLNAINESIAAGGKDVQYEALSSTGGFYKTKKGVGAKAGNPGQERFARTVAAEAEAIAKLANELIAQYPEFGLSPKTVPALVLDQKVEEKESSAPAKASTSPGATTQQEKETKQKAEPSSLPQSPRDGDNGQSVAPETTDTKVPTARTESASREEVKVEKEPAPQKNAEPEVSEAPAPKKETEVVPAAETGDKPSVSDEETAQADEEVVQAAETVSGDLDNLVKPGGKNWFLEAFKFPATMKSRLNMHFRPLKDLQEATKTSERMQFFMMGADEDLKYEVSGQDAANLQRYLNLGDKVAETVNRRLEVALGQLQDRLKTDGDLPRQRKYLALNIVEEVDGKFQYHPQLMEGAILAGLDWALNAQDRTVPVESDDLAEIFHVESVSEELVNEFNRGTTLDMAVRSLSDLIRQFWGVDANRDTPENYVRGIPEAVAKEVLFGLEEAGLISLLIKKSDKDDTRFTVPGSNKKMNMVRFDGRSEEMDRLINSLAGVSTLISDMVLVESLNPISIDKPIEEIDGLQHRNPMVETTKQQKEALRNAQKTGYRLNKTVYDFYQALGLENFVSIMTGREYKDGDLKKSHRDVGLNKNHWASIQGRQRSFVNAYLNVTKQVAQMQKVAEKAGKPIEELAVYYKHHINRLGRPQMDGRTNPQSDKTAREIFMPTRDVINLKKPKEMNKFLATIGQGIGLKTEKKTRSKIVEEVRQKTMTEGGEFYSLVQHMRSWLNDQTNMSTDLVDELGARVSKSDLSQHGIQSLLTLARYLNMEEAGDHVGLTKFETFSYMEADGKTNGAINSLLLYSRGLISGEWLRTVSKGGAFLGRKFKTLNSLYTDDDTDPLRDPNDLYMEGALATNRIIEEMAEKLTEVSPQAKEVFDALRRFMAGLNVDIKLTEKGIAIGRSTAKNPLTITIYGSGANGIAGNAADELLSVIYEKMMSDELYDGFSDDFRLITSQVAIWHRRSGNFFVYDHNQVPVKGNPFDYTIDPSHYQALIQNLRTFFVDPMRIAIEETVTKHVEKTTSTIQQATHIQSVVAHLLFRQKIGERLEMKAANPEKYGYRKGDFLSANEMDEIREQLKTIAPFIQTGTQSYMLSGSERASVEKFANGITIPRAFSRSLDDNMETAAYYYSMTPAGVKSTPTLTIGSGDGQMQLLYLAENRDGSAERTGHVFDGSNFPASKIEEYSTMINEAVFKTWTTTGNPVKAVYESYQQFRNSNPLSLLNEEAKTEFYRMVLNLKRDAPITSKERNYVDSLIARLGSLLEEVALETEARRLTYLDFDASVDQMASAESPYQHKGRIEMAEDASYEELADAMNDVYQEHMANLKGAKKSATIAGIASELGEQDAFGVRIVRDFSLLDAVNKVKEHLSPVQLEVAQKAAKTLAASGYRMVIGSMNNVRKWERATIPNRYVPTLGANGKVDPVEKVITLYDRATPETLVHELIHAATFHKVAAYYNDPKSLTKEEAEAVRRTEGLMQEWRELDPVLEDGIGYAARMLAEGEIDTRLRKGQKAQAVNEFMAWVLANQGLARLAAKTKVENPLFRIIGDAIAALKRLIGLKDKDDMLSQLRFNTYILMETPSNMELTKENSNDLVLHQSASFGANDRLVDWRRLFNRKIASWMKEKSLDPQVPTAAQRKYREWQKNNVRAQAIDMANSFARFFPSLGTMQGQSTFTAIQMALMLDLELNANALNRIQEIYAHVIDKLEVSHFRENDDPNDQADIFKAEQKLNALHGVFGVWTDDKGRSSLMSSFLALAIVDDDFRNVLSTMGVPRAIKTGERTIDGMLFDLANQGMDRMSRYLSGEKNNDGTVLAALEDLTRATVENVGDQRTYIELTAENKFDMLEKAVADGIQDKSQKLIDKSRELSKSKNAAVRAAGRIGIILGSMVNEDAVKVASLGAVQWFNRRDGFHEFRALLNDLLGENDDNEHVVKMISFVRSTVQQVRQRFREELPKVLESKFKIAPTKEQWTAMYKALGKTDLASLASTLGVTDALELIRDYRKLSDKIASTEQTIRNLDRANFDMIKEKAEQLAHFMNTGEHGKSLLTNAHAIARLLHDPAKARTEQPKELVDAIDQLVSLYSIEGLSREVRNSVADLIDEEKEGVEFVTAYLVGQRRDELDKIGTNEVARLNHFKGYIPSEKQQGGSLIIAEETRHADLVFQGYKKIAPYVGSSADRGSKKMAYYFSPVSPKAAFNQGVMQTIHTTVAGIDPETGFTVGQVTGGRIYGKQAMLSQMLLAKSSSTSENLLPRWDEEGNIVAFERMADPKQLVSLHNSTHLAQMIGAWQGRQLEEALATEVNKTLVDQLYDKWREDSRKGRAKEYVNIAKLKAGKDDPILVEAANLIPRQTRDYIREVFGQDEFWVRRDVLVDTLGYRQVSVGDIFTGAPRWDPKIASAFEKVAITVFKRDAFTKLVGTERTIQDIVANLKTTIVVRSVVVPVANMVSNMFQLLNRGVSLRDILKGVPAKTAEVHEYLKGYNKTIALEGELRAAQARGDLQAIRRLTNQVRSIKDSWKRMSIWPLIEAGEFTAISNGTNVTVEDISVTDNRWTDWMERKINNLPTVFKEPLRQGLITRDTALFQGMARAVQYGDFIAKAILYDDLTKRRGTKPEAALRAGRNAFINYNRPMGRGRQYLESMGPLWFFNYMLRAVNEAAYMLRHHPLRSLLMMAAPPLPVIGDIGSPTTDNIFSVLADGRLGYSIGPEQGFNSFGLNPWVNLVR